jgi:RNA polymerase sigma-70 factor, ECF subfamily
MRFGCALDWPARPTTVSAARAQAEVADMPEPEVPSSSALFDTHWPAAQPAVKRYIVSFLGRNGAIDEVVQEVAYACLRRLATFDPQRNFTAWALGIARLEIFTHRRRQVLLPLEHYPELEVVMSEAQEAFIDEGERRRRALVTCQERLSDQQRSLITLHYVNNHSHEQMAEQLNMLPGTVRVALTRIRALLRNCVEHRLAGTAAS